ncbi:hypothetical protein K8I31_09995 [bacterium]|nr:hypothetical protein [bacterium]
MLKRTHRRIFIEAVVAFVVIGVLMLAMLPSFFRAQGGARVAQALGDLAAIAQAMEAYNMASETMHIAAYHDDEKKTPVMLGYERSVFPFSGSHEIPPHTFTTNPLSEYLSPLPTPPQSMRPAETRRVAEGGFIEMITEQKMMEGQYDVGLYYPTGFAFSFLDYQTSQFIEPQARYTGIFYGPRLDPLFYTVETDGSHSSRGYYVRYDPTNGTNSHGYTVYYSAPAQSAYKTAFRFEDAIPHYPKFQKDRSSWLASYRKFDELRGERMYNFKKTLAAFEQIAQTKDDQEFAEYVSDYINWQDFSHECMKYKMKNLIDENGSVLGFETVEQLESYAEFQRSIWPSEWEVGFPIRISQRRNFFYFSDELLDQLREKEKQP